MNSGNKWRRHIRRNSLWFAAGEIVALFLVPLFAWAPCDRWLGWATSCPPSPLLIVAMGSVAYLVVGGLLWWIDRHCAGEAASGDHG